MNLKELFYAISFKLHRTKFIKLKLLHLCLNMNFDLNRATKQGINLPRLYVQVLVFVFTCYTTPSSFIFRFFVGKYSRLSISTSL